MSRGNRPNEPKTSVDAKAAAPANAEPPQDGAPKPQGAGAKKRNPDYDPLIANEIFPDAEAVFTTPPKRLEQVRDTACVVLDTNALLLPYEVSPVSLKNVEQAYTKLIADNRLFIPAQVAREFARNRAKKLGEVHESLSNRRSQFQPKQVRPETRSYALLETFPEYKRVVDIEKRFGEIDREVQELTKEYRDKLGEAMQRIGGWEWDDPVSQIYNRLFKKDIIKSLSSPPKTILDEHTRRDIHQIPPGYQDGTKDDGGIGDVLIWLTILEIGKTRNNSVIFVTGEKKPDWWHKAGSEPIYPRYELLDEFRRHTGHSFHILNLSGILEQLGAATDVLAEVRRKEANIYPKLANLHGLDHYRRVEESVRFWLSGMCTHVQHVDSDMGFDFLVMPNDGPGLVGVEVKACRSDTNPSHLIQKYVARLQQKALSSRVAVSSCWFVLAYPCQESALASQAILLSKAMEFPFVRLTVIVGYLTEEGQFTPMNTQHLAGTIA